MTLSDNEIRQILDEFLDMTTERQYIGARYVPLLGRKDEDSVLWDNTAPYEPLTIVLYQGNSYTSRQYVPIGIDISNTDFWAQTGNYNAQIELYRQETQRVQDELDTLEFESVRPYNTVAEMQADTELQVGMICHTNGFHSSGDGGAAWYKIASTGTANNMDVIECGELYATLVVQSFVTPEMLGAYGNATVDCHSILQYLIDNYQKIKCNGKYTFSESIEINKNNFVFDGCGEFTYTGQDYAFGLSGYSNNLFFNYVRCTDAAASAFRLATEDSFGQNTIKISRIFSSYNGIEYISDDYSVAYNKFYINTVTASNHGLHVEIECEDASTGTNWFNSNYIYDATFIGQSEWGIWLKCTLTNSNPVDIVNGNNFINFSTENTRKGIYLYNARWNYFEGFRGIDYQSTNKVISLNEETLYNTFKVVNFLWYGNIENNLSNANANNIFEGQIGLSDGVTCWNKISVQKPVTYVADAIGITPIEYANGLQKVTGTWVSGTSQVINPFQNRGYATNYFWISDNDVEVTLPSKYYNAQCIREVFFFHGVGAPKSFKVHVNQRPNPSNPSETLEDVFTLSTPYHLRFYTNEAGSSFGCADF